MKKIIFLWVLLLTMCVMPVTAYASETENKTGDSAESMTESNPEVLFLSSYNYDWDSIPLQLEGLTEVLNGNANMSYVFMDTKNQDYEQVKNLVEEKVQMYLDEIGRFDYIIAGDDNALHFVMDYRQELFQNTPVIFEGINNEEFAGETAEDPLITGIVETFPLEQTIAMAKEMFPDATRVVGISDSTRSGTGSSAQLLDCKRSYEDMDFEILNVSEMTGDEISSKISEYGEDTVLIYLMFTYDRTGRRYSNTEAVNLITQSARVPVFKADELGIGDGILGGTVISYKSMGAAAGQMVLDIESGENIADMETQTTDSIRLFDKSVMNQFGIKKSDVSENAEFINDLPGFFATYRVVLIPSVIIILAVFSIILVWYFYEKKQMVIEREEEANKEKERFLATVSHDMRTPLNAILGLTELMLDKAGDTELKKDLIQLNNSGKYLLNLINDTLDVSRIESGKLLLHPTVMDRRSVVNNILTLLDESIKERKIALNVNIEKLPYTMLYVDTGRLEQVVMNVLSNAIKFTPEGGTVDFIIENISNGDGVVVDRVTVKDTGIGMSKEFLPHLFEPFSRENDSSKTKYDGTGLGMPISKQIIEMMNGSIDVTSEKGKGTTVSFTLEMPLATESQIEEYRKWVNIQAVDQKDVLAGKCVLICEDHPLNAMIAQKLLEKKGMITEVAENGKIGVSMFETSEAGHYQAVLMDIRMPEMDGLEATRAIRSSVHAQAKTIPVIAMTANAFETDVQNCLDAGMNEHLAKPIDPELLYRTLNKYMRED